MWALSDWMTTMDARPSIESCIVNSACVGGPARRVTVQVGGESDAKATEAGRAPPDSAINPARAPPH